MTMMFRYFATNSSCCFSRMHRNNPHHVPLKRLCLALLLSVDASSLAFAVGGRSTRTTTTTNYIRRGIASSSSVQDHNELPENFPRREDVLIALAGVRKACRVTQALQPNKGISSEDTYSNSNSNSTSTIGTVEKADLSPVTVADYAVQALLLQHLYQHFPNDGFIAEEDSAVLQQDDYICQQVVQASGLTQEDALTGIDLGKSYTKWTSEEPQRPPNSVWCLDPVDGTKGFLRGKRSGGQYAIALALVEQGVPTIGILGCPNLPTHPSDEQYAWQDDETEENNSQTRGCIFVASRGGGCYQLNLEPRSATKLSVTPNDASTRPITEGRFCIGVEKFSDALGHTGGMAQLLHGEDCALDKHAEIIKARRIDSQAKHGVIARGGAEWYVRLPKPGYVEWIWDHAAGNVVIEEAGGQMSDTNGKPLDFSLGPKLSPRVRGILMSNGGVFHTALVDAYQKQDEKLQKSKHPGDSL